MRPEEEKTVAYPPGWQPPSGPYQGPVQPAQPGGGYQEPLAPTIRQGAPGGSPVMPSGQGMASPVQKTVMIGREEASLLLAWLVVVQGSQRGRIFTLSQEATTIGRDGTCEIYLDDDTVSRQHARVKVQKEGDETEFYLFDLASTAGTTVNGESIMRCCLHDGDKIVMGRTLLVFKRV